eukprot:CAMPEP_0113620378 /NCGR_PEP_ID=MMETSP0017_2-20120614/10383_1 /TAXON_ID=2856 /ORGANISM="Cylindrotheca closterium" /LENGTH=213 /DNA_ID=CAMNT_0000530039 /DNA_START=31 /DNA_END=672 /DNA_ORIENTATION=+ /assembly_acc=CAM_ASM_000147
MASHEIDIVEKRQEEFRSSRSLKAWNITTALSLIIPLVTFFSARAMNRSENNDDDAKYDDAYAGGNDQDDNEESQAPWWWAWKENIEQETHEQILVLFLYLWTFTMAILLTITVNRNFSLGKLKSVRWSLVGFINYSFICAVVVGGIPELISDKGAELEETGWYGQNSVLLLLTCLFQMLSSSIFVCAIGKMIAKQREDLEKEAKTEHPYSYF